MRVGQPTVAKTSINIALPKRVESFKFLFFLSFDAVTSKCLFPSVILLKFRTSPCSSIFPGMDFQYILFIFAKALSQFTDVDVLL